MSRYARWVAFVLAAVLATPALAQAPRASVDRNPLRLGESLLLTIEVEGGGHAAPSFTTLGADFERLGTRQRSETRIDNGRLSRTTRWEVSLSPRREGTLRIPPIRVAGASTEPIDVEVRPAGSRDSAGRLSPLFLEAEVQPDGQPRAGAAPASAYVGQQLVLSVRLYFRVNLGIVDFPDPNTDGLTLRRFQNERRYESTLDGERYQVLERRYAIVPERAGRVRIGAARFVGERRDARQRDAMTTLFGRGRSVRVSSTPIEFDVLPRPAGIPVDEWLPARDVELVETLPERLDSLRAGDLVQRTVTLRVVGQIGDALAPLASLAPAGERSYAERPQLETREQDSSWLVGERTERVAVLPSGAGALELPAVEVAWWDVTRDARRVARIPARTLDIAPAETATPSAATAAATDAWWRRPQPLQWLVVAAAALWLLTLTLWLRERGRGARLQVSDETPPRLRSAHAELARACKANDAPRARRALLSLARAGWPDNPPITTRALGRRVGSPALRAALDALDAALFGPEGSEPGDAGAQSSARWRGASLWAAANDLGQFRTPDAGHGVDPLPALYPRGAAGEPATR